MNEQEADAGMLRIVRGNPNSVEIAALTTVTASLAASGDSAAAPARLAMWSDRAAALRHPGGRRPLRAGPTAWRASALPY